MLMRIPIRRRCRQLCLVSGDGRNGLRRRRLLAGPEFPRPAFRVWRFQAVTNFPAAARRSFRVRPVPGGDFGLGRCRGGFRFIRLRGRLRVQPHGAGHRLLCRRRRRWGLVRRFLLRGRWLDMQHRQNGCLRNGFLGDGCLRDRFWISFAAQKPVRGSHATTECWRIPRERRAATPRRRVRTPVSTSTTRSRRTENESPGAWTPVPPSRDRLRRPLSQKGTR